MKEIKAFSAGGLVESMIKDVRNKFRDIAVFFKELKEGVSSMKSSWQSEKISFKEI